MGVLGIDVDGTLCKEICFTAEECRNATPRFEVINRIKEVFKDHFVVIATARRFDLAEETLIWLDRYHVPYNAITFKKPAVDWLIDDRVQDVENFIAEGLNGKGIQGR